MASSWALLTLLLAAFTVAAIESRAVPHPDGPAVTVDQSSIQDPAVRNKRQAYRTVYPQRTLMLTGFYRPARQPSAGNGAVYAQGNSVAGGAFFQPRPAQLEGPAEEPEAAIADAEAAAPELLAADEEEADRPVQQDRLPEVPQDTPSPRPEQPAAEQPAHKSPPKKSKKVPVAPPPEPADDEEYEDEEEEEEEEVEALEPVRPTGGKRKPRPQPSLNNYFPMVFSFPTGTATRGGQPAGGLPGLITAIANSYSTSKGGIASSVATAYGAAPTKKQRRTSATTD